MYAGLWMYAWDVADEGVDKVMGWAAESGLTALQIAGAYHSGWFVHPHNPKHRAYMPAPGTVYFQPQKDFYTDTPLKPQVAPVCAKTDWMREVGKRLDKHGLKLVSWTVCCHNTRLGLLHPECTVHNAFGDSYPHALSPANESVRRYLVALCRDLAHNLPMHAIQLESPDYLGWQHGHHHERDLTVLSPVEAALMSVPFDAATMRRAEAKGIDASRFRTQVKALLEAAMSHAPGRPTGHPNTLEELTARLPDWNAYQAVLRDVEDSLLHEIKAVMGAVQLYQLGGYRLQNAQAVDAYHHCFYGQKAAPILASTQAAKAPLEARHALHIGLRLGLNSVADAAELTEIVRAIRQGGGDGVMFYNYSESPMTALNWIKPALKVVGSR